MKQLVTAKPLQLGDQTIWPPVVLAPMAGVTNQPFRTLCREFGPGLVYVNEMIMAAALVYKNPKTEAMIAFGPDESFRSLQLYGSDPTIMANAITQLGRRNAVDHIDLNFGCPVPKVTRRGGGAALPYKRRLFSAIVESAVSAASKYGIPVTVKMRVGIDSDHQTFLESAKSAADLGVTWVALHARTAAQLYEGRSDWNKITELVEHLAPTGVPVLGNGDIWSGKDATSMMEQTGCAGVVVGRGCLGRPWLFADLVSAINGENKRVNPTLFEVRQIMLRHGQLLVEYFENEDRAMRDVRKHMAWYLKGFSVPREIRANLGMVNSLEHMQQLLSNVVDQPYPQEVGDGPRGRTSHGRQVKLPDGWLDDPDEFATISIDDAISGG